MIVSFVFPPSWAPWAPSYGMALLAGACRREGHRFHGFDLNIDFYRAVSKGEQSLWLDDGAPNWMNREFIQKTFDKYADFLDAYIGRVLESAPQVVAVSVQSASTFFGLEFARRVRKHAPDVFILFGGPDCFPSESGISILENSWVDAICMGEGDEVLPLYLDMLAANGMRPPEAKGFGHRRPDGSIYDGGQPDPVLDLDALPYADFSGIDFSRYSLSNRICMMTSRGCILRCSYCSEGANFLRYRSRSAESLIDEVERHVNMLRAASRSRPHINFSDSLINGRPATLERFCQMILDRGIDFSWGGMALLREEMTLELMTLMRKAGWIEVMWGLESGSSGTLKLMRKKLFSPELAERVIRDAASLGVDQCTNVIVGFPGETEEQFAETVDFVRHMSPYFRTIGLPMMEIRRNSFVYDNPRQFGVADPRVSMLWQTEDGSNTIEVRQRRRAVLADIIAGKVFDQGRYREGNMVSISPRDGVSPITPPSKPRRAFPAIRASTLFRRWRVRSWGK